MKKIVAGLGTILLALIFLNEVFAQSAARKNTWRVILTKVCREQNWAAPPRFTNCLRYAKKHGFFAKGEKIRPTVRPTENELSKFFSHIGTTTQGGSSFALSPVVPLAPLAGSNTTAPHESFSLEIPPLETTAIAFTPVAFKNIDTNFFANVLLSSPLPNHFSKDEIYSIEGDLVGIEAKEAFVFVCPENGECSDSTNFTAKTIGNHFKILVHFREIGNFKIGIIPGRSGQSRITLISVLQKLPAPLENLSDGSLVTNLDVRYSEGKTTFTWEGSSRLTHLIIFQGKERKDFIFRQPTNSFTASSKEFASFQKGPLGWKVEQLSTSSPIQIINVTTQQFRKIETEKIHIQEFQEVLKVPGKLTIKGKTLSPLSKKAAVTLPNGRVKEYIFIENDLSVGQDFSLTIDLPSLGTYIVELNTPEGGALLNAPVYVGTEIPLLPDFFALHPQKLDPAVTVDLQRDRELLLRLINTDRANHTLPPVQLNEDLNSVAQTHSQNMANLNFFGHTDPAGLTPDDRRRKAKIPVGILENLGKASTLEFVEAGLMRSPIHRAAILDPGVKRVGLGIMKNAEGYFIVTQNFSADPLDPHNLPALENTLIENANRERTLNNLSMMTKDSTLQELASAWSLRMANERFFGVSSPQGDRLLESIRNRGISASVQIYTIQISSQEKLGEELTKQAGLKKVSNQKIGLGLAVDELGDIFMTAIYTP